MYDSLIQSGKGKTVGYTKTVYGGSKKNISKRAGLGKKLKEMREAAGLSVQTLSELSGLSRQTIYATERNDRTPRSDILKRWTTGLGVEMAEVLAGVEVTPKPPQPLVTSEGTITVRQLRPILCRVEGLDGDGVDLVMAVVKTRLAQNRREPKPKQKTLQ